MKCQCPTCGGVFAKPFAAAIETNTVSGPLGMVKLPYAEFDMFASLAEVYPGSKERAAVERDVWGKAEPSDYKVRIVLHRLRRHIAPIGLAVNGPYKRPLSLALAVAPEAAQ